jgi:urease accessory protein
VAEPELLLRLLAAMQLADSAFPSGAYTLSHGLESFVREGWLRDPEQIEPLVADYLACLVGPGDAVAAAWAARACGRADMALLVEVDRLLGATKLVAEEAAASARSGRQVLRVARALSGDRTLAAYEEEVRAGRSPGHLAVARGVLGGAWGLRPAEVAAAELYSFAGSLVGAALRTARLGHERAQRLLCRLRALVAELADRAASTPWTELCPFAPAVEVMQMEHQGSSVRLFAS